MDLKKKNKKINKFRKKHKIGLCLSGGGARGFCYLGAFKAFEECGIKFDMVAGTSVGSLFGALYATGASSQDLIEKLKFAKTADFRKSKLGFLPSKMDRLEENLNAMLPVKKIEDLTIPFCAVAVDLKTAKEVHLKSGNLATAITGSCSIPGVFYPVKHKNMTLIDGGVLNNIPVDVLKSSGCDFVITIDCNSTRGGGTMSNNLIMQFTTSIGIMMRSSSQKGLSLSDVLIQPDMRRFNSLKIVDKEEMIKEGYKATMQKIEEIENLFLTKKK